MLVLYVAVMSEISSGQNVIVFYWFIIGRATVRGSRCPVSTTPSRGTRAKATAELSDHCEVLLERFRVVWPPELADDQ